MPTLPQGRYSSSASAAASVVVMPCPISDWDAMSVTEPSLEILTQAVIGLSRAAPDAAPSPGRVGSPWTRSARAAERNHAAESISAPLKRNTSLRLADTIFPSSVQTVRQDRTKRGGHSTHRLVSAPVYVVPCAACGTRNCRLAGYGAR